MNFELGSVQRMTGFEKEESIEEHLRGNGFLNLLFEMTDNNKQDTNLDFHVFSKQIRMKENPTNAEECTINL